MNIEATSGVFLQVTTNALWTLPLIFELPVFILRTTRCSSWLCAKYASQQHKVVFATRAWWQNSSSQVNLYTHIFNKKEEKEKWKY